MSSIMTIVFCRTDLVLEFRSFHNVPAYLRKSALKQLCLVLYKYMYFVMLNRSRLEADRSKDIVINGTSTAKISDEVKIILKSFKVQDAVAVIFVNFFKC